MLKSNIKRTSTMMKRLFPTALAVLLLLLAGCTAKPDTSNQSKPAEYYLTDTDLPLDDAARLRAAPDFLTAEQQTLYRQAFALYSAMFDGETTGIDDAFPAADGQAEYDEYTPDGSDYTYISSHSRWQSWADFDRVVHALFTDTFWSTCNDDGNAPIYIEHDGRLFILDCAYGDQYYNSNIPDEFTLTAQTDDRIDFTVTAHYSYPYPRQDETEAERDERLKTSYEYTRIYPVTLIYHKPTHDNGEGGILFFIDCYPGEWSEDNPPVIAGHSVVVAQTEKDTYLLRTPSDVEYSASDPMLAEAYQSLIAQQDLIISHIYATGQTVIPPNE